MRRVFKNLLNVSVVAVFALLYVSMQNEIYRISYSIQKKEKQLTQTQDRYERIRMRVDLLRSFSSLEEKMQAANIGLILPTEVKTIEKVTEKAVVPVAVEAPRSSFSILQFVKEAQAKIASPDKD